MTEDSKDKVIEEYKNMMNVIRRMCDTVKNHPLYDRVDLADTINRNISDLVTKIDKIK